MTNWRQIPVPPICERMIGFSVPQDNALLVISYEGMHLIQLGSPITVETDPGYSEYDLYDPDNGTCLYHDKLWSIIGLHGGNPILESPMDETLVLNADAQTVSVTQAGKTLWSSRYENFSGDWAAVTFSPDGRYVVLGCPYDFDFRVWERTQPSSP